MKKFFKYIYILIILFTSSVYGEDNQPDLNDNSSLFNKGFVEQKQVSDTKFKKTVKEMKERALSGKQKRMRKQIQPNSPAADSEYLKTFTNSQDPDNALSQTLTVMIPVKAYSSDGKYIQPGYYKLSCRKIDNDKYVLELSQGTKKFMTVPASQTTQDLEQDTIQFCNAEVISNGRIRLMYGTIDLNLVAYIYFD